MHRRDVELARRDRAVPGLGFVLDPDAVAAGLRAAGHDVDDVVATYVRYKPATSCLVGYRMRSGGQDLHAYAKAVAADGLPKLRKLAERAARSHGGVDLPAENAAVAFFPYDHDLRALSRLTDPERLDKLLRRTIHESADGPANPGQVRAERLRYKPERRYVAKVAGPDGPLAVLKLYDRSDFLRSNRAAKSLGALPAPRVPRRIGASGRHRLVAYEWLDGELLEPGRHGPDVVRDVGLALSRLHRHPAAKLPLVGPEHAALAALVAARTIAQLLPDAGGLAREVATDVARRFLDHDAAPVVIHGDFTSDQVILAAHGPAFLDVDRAARGDAAADLGSFVADLHVRALHGRLPHDDVGGLAAALVAGYGDLPVLDRGGHLATWTAAALLRRAAEPFRLRMPDWPDLLHAIVDRARQVAS